MQTVTNIIFNGYLEYNSALEFPGYAEKAHASMKSKLREQMEILIDMNIECTRFARSIMVLSPLIYS